MRGFTLAEVMVSIAVVLLLSAMAIGYSASNRDQTILLRDEAAVVDYLSRARELALKGYAPGDTSGTCAYGIRFDASTPKIELIKYTNCTGDFGSAPSTVLETYTLIDRVTLSSGAVTDVAFIPPEITVAVNAVASLPAVITLGLGTDTVTITVNASGQITTS